jgi:conjugal transfer pilus assembly protein TraF
MMMTTIKTKRAGRLAAAILMLLAATAPVATPALAQVVDLQSAAMADAIDDDDAQASNAVVEAEFAGTPVAGEQQQGSDFYCGERRLGQWFYCERPKPKPSVPQASAQPQQSSTAQLKAITKQLDELKARAILEPTEANVIAYVRYQREQLDRASTFSDTWQRALWQNPDIDYTLQRPVSTVGKRAWTDNRAATRDQVLSRLGQRYGMFYFFAQSCAACEVFSPILRSVADSHRITVMAVSTDGGPSRQFPNYVVDSGQRQRMGVPLATPALVLFDTVTRKTVPVGFGVMSADEVMERIFMLTNSVVGSDF